jgi:UDP-glucose 4-epimerase
VTVFRFFNVFGPWQRADHAYAAVIPKWIERALNGDPIELHGDGEQSRDFTFVDTVVDVLTLTLQQRVSHPTPVNLAFGSQVRLNEILQQLETLLGPLEPVSHEPPRPGDIRHSLNDPTLVRQLYPAVEPVEFSTGLERTLSWMESRKDRRTSRVRT